jgi:hypothetical protein
MSVAGSGREVLQVVQWIKMHRDRTLGAAAVRDRGHRPAAQGELFSETNDNSVALLTCGKARVLLVGDAEAREEEYMASGSYTRP